MTTITVARLGRVRVYAALSTSVLAVAGLAGCASRSSANSDSQSTKGSHAITVQFVNPLPS